jgi:hypothetical protein
MALPFTVEKLDTLPEAHRTLYTKTEDGKYRLDLDGYEDPTNLKSALDKERKAARDAVAMTKAWKELGKTPEEISDLLSAHAKAEAEKLTKAGEWDKLRGQMTEQHTAELVKKDEAVKSLRGQLEKHLVDAAAVAALAAQKGNAELLLPHVKSRVKVIEENGEFSVRVVDVSGNPRVNAKGEYLSMADLVGEMRQSEVFASAFLAPGASGGGARQSNTAGGPSLKGKVDGTPEERVAYFASKYPDLKT